MSTWPARQMIDVRIINERCTFIMLTDLELRIIDTFPRSIIENMKNTLFILSPRTKNNEDSNY